MTASQATLLERGRCQPSGSDADLSVADRAVQPLGGLGRSTGHGWPVEPLEHPPLGQEDSQRNCIPRIGGGRLLPPELQGAVIALGNFDGFHIGHQAVVDRAVEMARSMGVAAIVATFDPHPVRHFTSDAAPFHLTTLSQRQRLFAQAGVDAMMVFDFDGVLANVTPQEFVQRWLPGVSGVVTGDGFTFGRRRAGTVAVFSELASAQGIAYEAVQPVSVGGERVSSTRVREALRRGDCTTVRSLLTRPFAVSGKLRSHERLDPRRDCFLASIDMAAYLRPRAGSYAGLIRFSEGRRVPCVAHVGPPIAAGPQDAALWLAAPNPLADMQGRVVEVDLLGRLPNA